LGQEYHNRKQVEELVGPFCWVHIFSFIRWITRQGRLLTFQNKSVKNHFISLQSFEKDPIFYALRYKEN
jgi:hypothetical protein